MSMKKLGLLFLCIMFLTCGCGSEKESNQAKSLSQVLEANNYVVIDVRTEMEYEKGHVLGALNIPYNMIDESVDLDKEKTILVYCQSGKRSSIAYQTLKDLGYEVLDLGAYDTVTLEKE